MALHLNTQDWKTQEGPPFNLAQFVLNHGSGVVMIKYSAEWCGPCKKIAPHFHRLAQECSDTMSCYEVDVDQSEDLAEVENIQSLPTFRAYRAIQVENPVTHVTEAQVAPIQELKGASLSQLEFMMRGLHQAQTAVPTPAPITDPYQQTGVPVTNSNQQPQTAVPVTNQQQQTPTIENAKKGDAETLRTLAWELQNVQGALLSIAQKVSQLSDTMEELL